jgi:hypothetical protein
MMHAVAGEVAPAPMFQDRRAEVAAVSAKASGSHHKTMSAIKSLMARSGVSGKATRLEELRGRDR